MLEKHHPVPSEYPPYRKTSWVARGLTAYMLSAPAGTPVDFQSLTEGSSLDPPDEVAAALREMESAGYLYRLCEYTTFGRLVTRTHAHRTEEG